MLKSLCTDFLKKSFSGQMWRNLSVELYGMTALVWHG